MAAILFRERLVDETGLYQTLPEWVGYMVVISISTLDFYHCPAIAMISALVIYFKFTNPIMNLSHIPQYTIQYRNLHVLFGMLHCGYGAGALWNSSDWSTLPATV